MRHLEARERQICRVRYVQNQLLLKHGSFAGTLLSNRHLEVESQFYTHCYRRCHRHHQEQQQYRLEHLDCLPRQTPGFRTTSPPSCDEIANELCRLALRLGSADNITVSLPGSLVSTNRTTLGTNYFLIKPMPGNCTIAGTLLYMPEESAIRTTPSSLLLRLIADRREGYRDGSYASQLNLSALSGASDTSLENLS